VCKLNITPRYKPFSSIKAIVTPPLLGFIITINFIVGLPKIVVGNDSALTTTYKYSKKVDLYLGSIEFTVER